MAIAWLLYVAASWVLAWTPADAGAYFDAATRLRSGADLYTAASPEAHEVYRYAPWFAHAWIPLSYLPRDAVMHGWSVAMLVCSGVAVWPIVRLGTPAAVTLAALLGAFLVETAMFGNAHPAVVALLVVAAGRSAFPVAIGVASSVKLVPILLVGVWIGRREWRPALVALATALVLWSHALLFDLGGYVTDPGTGLMSLYAISPILWFCAAAAAAAASAVLVVRRSRWAWVAIAVLMFLGPPRVVLSYLAFLAPALIATLDEGPGRV
ncbi:MAG: glycosyltransferase 87 family protein [Chloroflexi bacterium]|nr:glycosyltransferase 87 family protein [Chloroflexota bacterium]